MPIGILGLLALFTSYIVIGDNTRDVLQDDILHSPTVTLFLVVALPMLLVLMGLQQFIVVISIAGGVFLALEALFINRMWEKAYKPGFSVLSAIVYAVFGIAMVYEFASLFYAF